VWERRGEYRRVEEKRGEVRKWMDVPLHILIDFLSIFFEFIHSLFISIHILDYSHAVHDKTEWN
jgi:hypothetical protein